LYTQLLKILTVERGLLDINPRTLAIVNYTIQILLMITIIIGAIAARKQHFQTHCGIIRVAVVLQIVLSLAFMLPYMSAFYSRGILSTIEMLAHHLSGIA
jgi:hypothetical protein